MQRFEFWPDWYIDDGTKDVIAELGDGWVYRCRRDNAGGEPEEEAVLQILLMPGSTEAQIREKLQKISALRQYPGYLVPEDTYLEPFADGNGYTVYMRTPEAETLDRYARTNIPGEKDLELLEQQLRSALTVCDSKGVPYGEIRSGDLFAGKDGRLLLGASALLRSPGSRPQSTAELNSVLRTAAGMAAAPGPEEPEPPKKILHMSRPVAIIACVALFLLSGFLFYSSIHFYTEPTCTTAAVCKICGKVGHAALGHDYAPATCTEPETCRRCGAKQGTFLGHDWQPATCTEPEICSRCGATQGTALGHDYGAATCTEPGTCTRCGATSGTALGHDYADATCTKPKTCRRCGATTGSALGHDWKDATYDAPKTCKRCGATDGHVKGYVSGSDLAKGKWSEATVTLQDFNTHPWLLDNKLKKCRKITISITITEITKGSANTNWGFYVRSGGSWKEVGRVTISEINKEYKSTFKIDPSMDVDAFMYEPISRREISWRASYRFYEAQVD